MRLIRRNKSLAGVYSFQLQGGETADLVPPKTMHPTLEIVAIVNPASRDGSLKKQWPIIEQHLKAKGVNFELIFTEYGGHASEIACALTKRNNPPKLAIAVGGDGTINEVARGLRGSSVVLGIIPFGSGNDYARAHGIDKDYQKAIEVLLHGVDRTVGAICVEACPAPELKGVASPQSTPWDGPANTPGMVRRWAFEECDIGVTASVGRRKCEGEGACFRGSFKYTWLGLVSIFNMPSTSLQMTIDTKAPRAVRIPGAVAMTATETFGGGYRVCPGATPVARTGSICIASGLSKLKLLRLMGPLKKGTHIGLWGTTLEPCTRVRIDVLAPDGSVAPPTFHKNASQNVWLQVDGEVNLTAPAYLEYCPAQLTVRGAASIPNGHLANNNV